jgi:hypothetical protein
LDSADIENLPSRWNFPVDVIFYGEETNPMLANKTKLLLFNVEFFAAKYVVMAIVIELCPPLVVDVLYGNANSIASHERLSRPFV